MPKLINDVEKTIRDCATKLFIELSYINVDMRMISKRSGIAVGTLYNYYENKRQLYLSILNESWQNTFKKLDVINELTILSKEKLREFIVTLYEEVEERNGLGKVLINTSVAELTDVKEINDLKNSLISRVENLFKCFNKVETFDKCSEIDTRLTEVLLSSMLIMLEFHPNEKEGNIDFLVDFMSLSIKI